MRYAWHIMWGRFQAMLTDIDPGRHVIAWVWGLFTLGISSCNPSFFQRTFRPSLRYNRHQTWSDDKICLISTGYMVRTYHPTMVINDASLIGLFKPSSVDRPLPSHAKAESWANQSWSLLQVSSPPLQPRWNYLQVVQRLRHLDPQSLYIELQKLEAHNKHQIRSIGTAAS